MDFDAGISGCPAKMSQDITAPEVGNLSLYGTSDRSFSRSVKRTGRQKAR